MDGKLDQCDRLADEVHKPQFGVGPKPRRNAANIKQHVTHWYRHATDRMMCHLTAARISPECACDRRRRLRVASDVMYHQTGGGKSPVTYHQTGGGKSFAMSKDAAMARHEQGCRDGRRHMSRQANDTTGPGSLANVATRHDIGSAGANVRSACCVRGPMESKYVIGPGGVTMISMLQRPVGSHGGCEGGVPWRVQTRAAPPYLQSQVHSTQCLTPSVGALGTAWRGRAGTGWRGWVGTKCCMRPIGPLRYHFARLGAGSEH
jgi:hypothetical protein